MDLASKIDHTYLKADCTNEIIEHLCAEAIQYQFASVCVPPNFVAFASEKLKQSSVKVCTVIGFPLGYQTTETKVFETENAIKNGATEIDMVIAIGLLKEGRITEVKSDIQQVFIACQSKRALLKVIIETALLTQQEKQAVIECCAEIGVDFVKTSTGFSTAGATKNDVSLMRKLLPETIQIKAAGGIKTKEFALELLNAGANRLGCSSSVSLLKE